MFTGLVEDVGRVRRWQMRQRSGILTLATKLSLRELRIGSSIAVNGACLTVVEKSKSGFSVDVSPETLKRTNFDKMKPGDLVNLERSLRLSDRLGGHLVTGHVDGTATVDEIKKKGDFIFFSFRVAEPIFSLIVSKGSIAVDGISLTVNEHERKYFSVAVIPFTLNHTNLRTRRLGDRVNIEVDIIARYIKQLLRRTSSKGIFIG